MKTNTLTGGKVMGKNDPQQLRFYDKWADLGRYRAFFVIRWEQAGMKIRGVFVPRFGAEFGESGVEMGKYFGLGEEEETQGE